MEREYILKQQEVRQERHIKAYFRYRDDIFLIARWQRQPRHACETQETRCNLVQLPVLDQRLGGVKVNLLFIWTLNCTTVHLEKQ